LGHGLVLSDTRGAASISRSSRFAALLRDCAVTITQSGMLTLINPGRRADPFDHADSLFEIKLDGFRIATDTVRGLMSRNGNRMQRVKGVLDLLPRGHLFEASLSCLMTPGVFNELSLGRCRPT